MNTYLNARVCYLHKVNKAAVLLVIEIFENDNHSISVNLIEHLKDEKADNFRVTLIDKFNEIICLNSFEEIRSSITSFSHFLIISTSNKVFFINIYKKEMVSSTEISSTKSKINIIYSINQTDDFIALNDDHQIFYFQFDENKNKISVTTRDDFKALKLEILNDIVAVQEKSKKEIIVYKLNQMKHDKVSKEPIFRLKVDNLEHFCISQDGSYIALFENPKVLSLYRLKDSSKCGQIEVYSRINCMIISDKFVNLAMKDRRILSYLIVDPLENDHLSRIKELPSRYLKLIN